MSRTVRLALVMNGGISLAVWMGGVAKELDLAVRASQGRSEGIAPADRSQFDRWAALCARDGDVCVEIDVVAGTSAGGLNGTILATSHGVGAALPDLKQMWRESASLDHGTLLPPETQTSSVLDGTFFEEKVDEVLGGILSAGDAGAARVPSPMTLFVTSTALGDHLRAYEDSYSQGFRSPDHRRVYRFRSRPPSDAENEFRASSAALGLAARASAGFPVAFAPVKETPQLLRHALGPRDHPSWLMDGGVLDNAPFGPVLDEIVTRPVDTEVERIVVYVVPSDGDERAPRHAASAPGALADSHDDPPSWSTVLRSALRFPSEADFRDDLDELTRIFATADARRSAAVLALRTAVGADPGAEGRQALLTGSASLRALYLAQQPRYDRAAFIERIQGRTGKPVALAPLLPPDSTVSVSAEVVPDDLGAFGHSAAERMVRNLLADLRTWLREPEPPAGVGEGARLVSAALGDLVRQREEIEDAVTTEVDADDASDGGVLADLVGKALLEGAEGRRRALEAAIDAYATAVDVGKDVAAGAVVAVEIVTQALAPQVRSAPPPFRLLRLGPDNDSPLAPRAAAYGERKLYGTRLGHFGAFGEQTWRDWDWAWGRLDAAAQLGRVLKASPEEIKELQQGVWAVDGDGRDLDAATVAVGELEEKTLRRSFRSETVNGLLDSAARVLGAEHAGDPEVVTAVASRLGTMLRTSWSPNPLWVFPGLVIRRKVRAWFR